MTASRAARHRKRMAPVLSALRDQDLGPLRRHLVQRHLRRCADCREVLQQIDRQVLGLRTLADTDPAEGPKAQMSGWHKLRADLGRPDARPSTWLQRQWPTLATIAAAAAVALLVAVKLPPDRLLSPAPSDDVMISLAEEEFREAEVHYQRALEQLQKVAARTRSHWTPEQTRVFQQRLEVLQRSTESARRIAQTRPADADAQEQLYAAYRNQIAFVQDALLAGPAGKGGTAP